MKNALLGQLSHVRGLLEQIEKELEVFPEREPKPSSEDHGRYKAAGTLAKILGELPSKLQPVLDKLWWPVPSPNPDAVKCK